MNVFGSGQYAHGHTDRINLLIHLLAVPLFWLGAASLVASLVYTDVAFAARGLMTIALSMGLQGLGHKREKLPAEPFEGPGDFLGRILAEQFLKFPAFVLSGRWWRNLLDSST